MIRKNVMLSEKQQKEIKELSEKNGISFSEMLRLIIVKFFEGLASGEK